jgi:hypothetical protein
MSHQGIYDYTYFIENYAEWKEIVHEFIYSDYTLDVISDLVIIKFLKSFRFPYKFVINIVEEETVAYNVEDDEHIEFELLL